MVEVPLLLLLIYQDPPYPSLSVLMSTYRYLWVLKQTMGFYEFNKSSIKAKYRINIFSGSKILGGQHFLETQQIL